MKYNNYNCKKKYKSKNNHHVPKNGGKHSEHPVRNVFYCIFCFFFSIAFSFLWVHKLFDAEKVSIYIVIAVLIIVGAIIGAIMSIRKFLLTQKARALYFENANKGYHKNKKRR